jgi:hypothetical protein
MYCYPWALWVVPKPPPLVLLPRLVQLSKNGRRRPETARHFFTWSKKRRFFFSCASPLNKRLTVRINRLDYETAIFFNRVHLPPGVKKSIGQQISTPAPKMDSTVPPLQRAGGNSTKIHSTPCM